MRDYTQAIGLGLKDAKIFESRAFAYSKQADWAAAIRDYSEALRLDHSDASWYVSRGIAFAEAGEFDRARQDYDEALLLRPHYTSALFNRAVLSGKTHDWERAIADFREVTRLDEHSASARSGLAWLLATCPLDKLRDPQEAIRLASAACEMTHWQDWRCVDNLAAGYAAQGEFAKAVQYQKEALALSGPSTNAVAGMTLRLRLYESQKPYREAEDPLPPEGQPAAADGVAK